MTKVNIESIVCQSIDVREAYCSTISVPWQSILQAGTLEQYDQHPAQTKHRGLRHATTYGSRTQSMDMISRQKQDHLHCGKCHIVRVFYGKSE